MKTFFDGIFIDSEKLKEEEIEYPIKLEYYKIISIEKSVEEKYGIEIVKTEYRDGNVYVESEKTENVTDSDEEINDNVEFKMDECPCCGGELVETGEITKDETSYRFVPIKRRNHFITYKCEYCKKEVYQNIPNHLKEDNQYGSEIKSVALSLANEGNVSMNKIRRIILVSNNF